MIKNDRQYRITKTRAQEFDKALAVSNDSGGRSPNALFKKLQGEAIESQLNDLRTELKEYELLQSGKVRTIEVDSLAALPQALIRARIARGWTQKKLAQELGIKEQQVQRYEADEYATASMDRVKLIAGALGLQLDKAVLKAAARSSFDHVMTRLEDVGLSEEFVESRLIPPRLKAQLEQRQNQGGGLDVVVAQIAARIGKIFGWGTEAILGKGTIVINKTQMAGVKFKMPTNADQRAVGAYTVYAHYLALLALECTPNLRYSDIPSDPITLRREIVRSEGTFDFESTLRFLWKHGVVVVPLRDKGMFHAAYWRMAGRHVIVLKQRTDSMARWLIDLLHEVRHLLSKPEDQTYSVVDSDDPVEQGDDYLDEEEEATAFAGECALNGSAEDLVHAAHARSKQNLRKLKSAVVEIATERNADLGLFANYVAYRLSLQGINWWGAATNLQLGVEAPCDAARRLFLERIDVNILNEFDREVLLQALKDE